MRYPGVLLICLSLLFAACGAPTEAEFGQPRAVSREQRPTTWDAPTRERLGLLDRETTMGQQGASAIAPQQHWTGTTPNGWEELPPQPERFREVLWRVAGNQDAECYLSVGVGGGVAGNMKRWYTDQNGIQDVPAMESLPMVEIAGRQGRLIELAGPVPPGKAMMIAFFAEGPQLTTLKFTGPAAVVKQNREQFLEAAKSLRMAVASPARDATPNPGGEKRWTGATPVGWDVMPPQPERFRELLWRVAGNQDTECYLSPAVGGGVTSNMTRWYTQQFGVAEVPRLEALPTVEIAGRQGRLVELAGNFNQKPGMAMLLAFFVEGEQLTTLKFTGPEAVVKQNREAFLGLAKSLRMDAASPRRAGAPAGSGQGPSPHEGANEPSGPPGTVTPAAAFTATVSAAWAVKTPSQRLLHYTFGSDGEIYVSQVGGALRPILDIWRGELGLPAMADAEFQALPLVPMLGAEGTLLDVAGNYRSMSGKQIEGARVLVAALVEGGSITFAKLVGKANEVGAQRDAFLQFLVSLRRTP